MFVDTAANPIYPLMPENTTRRTSPDGDAVSDASVSPKSVILSMLSSWRCRISIS